MDENYILLGQLYSTLCRYRHHYGSYFEILLEKSGYDLSYQIENSLIAKRKPEWLGYSILHFAVEHVKDDLIKLLLSRGADFTLKVGNGFTPLRLALKIMINAGRITYTSTLSSHIGSVPQLDIFLSAHIESNISKNPSCNDGVSHLHIACLTDNVLAVKLILEAGVPVNESISKTSDLFPGWSPLHIAVRYGSEDLVKLLLAHNADANKADGNGLTPLGLLVERSIQINESILQGNTKSQINIIENEFLRNNALIDIFINKDGHKNTVDNIGLSFLHVSCAKWNKPLIEKFFELSADVNNAINFDSPIWPGYTPAHIAAHCNPQIFKLLVKKGADIFAKDAKGITPIDLFVQRYKPTYVSIVFKLHPILKDIRFENGAKLVDVISTMRQESDFAKFMGNTYVNTRLPMNSPLWPGFTVTHLTLVMNKARENSLVSDNSHDKDALTETCLHLKASLAIKDANGMTPLHLAFYSHRKNIVDLILERIHHANSHVDRDGLSPLKIACIFDNVKLFRRFLKCGYDPNLPTRRDLTWGAKIYRAGSTLYHIAAINDCLSMIDEIHKSDCKMDVLDADGLTAVHVGFFNNCRPCILKKLLSHFDVQKINYTAENAGRLSHLHVACYLGDFESVKKLASVAEDIETPVDCSLMNIGLYAEQLAQYDGWTLLHFAVVSRDLETVNALIAKGADVCAKNAAGLNPLHLILKNTGGNDDCSRIIESLLKAGADVNMQVNVNSPSYPGDTGLHISIKSKSPDNIIKLLQKYGADFNLKNANDCTSIQLLWKDMTSQRMQFVNDIMIEAGPRFYEINPSNDDGLSHFHISCMIGNVDIAKKFIDSGVNVNESVCFLASKYAGCTPLHLAVENNKEEVVKLLLQNGANWKLENSEGRTPIQCAAVLGSLRMLSIVFCNDQIDIQETNVWDETTLKLLLMHSPAACTYLINSVKVHIKFVDPPAKNKDIAMVAWKLSNNDFRELVDRATDVTNVDADGKNIVHSIGSFNYNAKVPQEIVRCALNVNLWLEKGSDLNHQDKLGRTPLHDAVDASNDAVKVLLLLGVDVNVQDNQGRTAFSYLNDNGYKKEIFLGNILMMSCSGLHLDYSLDEIVRGEYDDESEARRNCNRDLARMTDVNITEDFTLRDLLSEKVIRNFSRFHVSKRDAILEFLRPQNLFELYETWHNWNNLFQMQYRKISRRMELLEPAKVTIYKLTNQLPLECVDLILKKLSNNDLEILIKV